MPNQLPTSDLPLVEVKDKAHGQGRFEHVDGDVPWRESLAGEKKV